MVILPPLVFESREEAKEIISEFIDWWLGDESGSTGNAVGAGRGIERGSGWRRVARIRERLVCNRRDHVREDGRKACDS